MLAGPWQQDILDKVGYSACLVTNGSQLVPQIHRSTDISGQPSRLVGFRKVAACMTPLGKPPRDVPGLVVLQGFRQGQGHGQETLTMMLTGWYVDHGGMWLDRVCLTESGMPLSHDRSGAGRDASVPLAAVPQSTTRLERR